MKFLFVVSDFVKYIPPLYDLYMFFFSFIMHFLPDVTFTLE